MSDFNSTAGTAAYEPVDASGMLAKNWWAILIRGLAALAFSLCAFVLPGPTLVSLVVFVAAYAAVDGVFSIVSAVRAARMGEQWASLVFDGLVSLTAAGILVVWPSISVEALIVLLAMWAIISGFLEIGAAFRLKAEHGRVWLGLAGVASVLFGVALFAAPFIGALVVTWWLGVYAAVFGITMVSLAITLKRRLSHQPAA
ncbi:HdeD family acid-resistance protein [Blastochloris sulfoviridis]|uniref:HdeD family acid-resistance protein n=1 Tax=Blastochloris sulfoviridis TaxID=50712 RepID=A0A5M6I4I8_9HYPH|nr:HdeD family acid-resistance protein [Blastochloris sulfoviridis]KAA5602725.1 HdeD family acid-resistance protein [Blastochloris sulfoviridis]